MRRAELLARLSALEQQIEAQAARVDHVRSMGWDVAVSKRRLDTLLESRNLYRSALKHLLGDDIAGDFTPSD